MKHRRNHIQHRIKTLKPKKLVIQRPVFWIIASAIFFGLTIFYFLFFFPGFQISAITVSGNQNINGNIIESAARQDIQKHFFGFSYKTIFMVNPDALKKNLLSEFPQIDDINVQKQWPQSLSLKITERVPVADFCLVGAVFFGADFGII